MRSRTAFWAVVSTTGRKSAKLRRSPFTLYCRAGNVTFRPPPPRRSQIAKPISLSPSSGPLTKWSSASASFPGGLPLSFAVILTVTVSDWMVVCMVLLLLGTVIGSFVRSQEPSRVPWRTEAAAWRPRPQASAASVSRSPGTSPSDLLGAACGRTRAAGRREPKDHRMGDPHASRSWERKRRNESQPLTRPHRSGLNDERFGIGLVVTAWNDADRRRPD